MCVYNKVMKERGNSRGGIISFKVGSVAEGAKSTFFGKKKVLFFAKKVTFFVKKSNFFFVKKVHFFAKKSNFYL